MLSSICFLMLIKGSVYYSPLAPLPCRGDADTYW